MKKRKLSDRAAEFVVSLNDEELAALKVDFLASNLGVNPSYLSRKFKSDKEMSLNEFITGEKMRRSAILLTKAKKVPIVTLAKITGFARADYFVILFRDYFGIHPKKYGQLRKHKFLAGDYDYI
ncbi:MAG: helix-turn-helix domain-containing protein [Candidatus Aminicenantes bacterium]|nr:MAG: helix-turn-helix domain-containing protein [Candidatus Aminicenantes bacterium]